MVGRDDPQVDVRRTTLVTDRARPLEPEPARAIGDDGRAAGADVLAKPIRLPEVDPCSREWPAVHGGEDDPGQDMTGADLRPPRRRTASKRAGAVVQGRPAAGHRGRRADPGNAETKDDETGDGREQPHDLRCSRQTGPGLGNGGVAGPRLVDAGRRGADNGHAIRAQVEPAAVAAASDGAMRRVTTKPNVTAGLKCPPEM